MGESFEIILDGQRVEAFLSDNVFVVDPHEWAGQFSVRAYAYALAAQGDPEAAKALLRQVGREGKTWN